MSATVDLNSPAYRAAERNGLYRTPKWFWLRESAELEAARLNCAVIAAGLDMSMHRWTPTRWSPRYNLGRILRHGGRRWSV